MPRNDRLHSRPMLRLLPACLIALYGCSDPLKMSCGAGMGLTLDGRCVPLDGEASARARMLILVDAFRFH